MAHIEVNSKSDAPSTRDARSRRRTIVTTTWLISTIWLIIGAYVAFAPPLDSVFDPSPNRIPDIVWVYLGYVTLGVASGFVALRLNKWRLAVVIGYSVLCLPKLVPFFVVQILAIVNIVNCARSWKDMQR